MYPCDTINGNYILLTIFPLLYFTSLWLFCNYQFVILFKKDFIYFFLERKEGKEKERERNINLWLPLMCPLLGTWTATQECAPTEN